MTEMIGKNQDPLFLGTLDALRNEQGANVNDPAYQMGLLNGLQSAFNYELESAFEQAIEEGPLSRQAGTMALNEYIGYDYMLQFHNTHGDIGGQLFGSY